MSDNTHVPTALRVGSVLVALAAVVMLIGAVVERWAYGYFQVLRWVTTAAAVLLVWRGVVQEANWTWVLSPLVILFNPVWPVHASKGTWQVMDLAAAVLIVAGVVYLMVGGWWASRTASVYAGAADAAYTRVPKGVTGGTLDAMSRLVSTPDSFVPRLADNVLKNLAIIGDKQLRDMARAGIAYTRDEWNKRMRKDVGEGVSPHLDDVWAEMSKTPHLKGIVSEGTSDAPDLAKMDIEPPPGPEQEISRLAKRAEEDAVSKGLGIGKVELTIYELATVKGWAEKAAALDPERAKRIALALDPPPADTPVAAIFEVVKHRAIRDGNIPLVQALAEAPVPEILGKLGHKIKAADARDPFNPFDPVRAIREINEAGQEAAKRRGATPAKIAKLQAELDAKLKELADTNAKLEELANAPAMMADMLLKQSPGTLGENATMKDLDVLVNALPPLERLKALIILVDVVPPESWAAFIAEVKRSMREQKEAAYALIAKGVTDGTLAAMPRLITTPDSKTAQSPKTEPQQ